MDNAEKLETDFAVVNGVKGNQPIENSSQPKVESSHDVFWKSVPQDEVVWHLPPAMLKPDQQIDTDEASQLIDGFARLLHDQPGRALGLKWHFQTRALAASAENRDVTAANNRMRQEILQRSRNEMDAIDTEIRAKDEQYSAAADEFASLQMELAEAMATAGLAVFTDEVAAESQSEDRTIAPSSTRFTHGVEDSINELLPTPEEIAGQHGVLTAKKESTADLILSIFMQFIAPLVAGLLLAVCLGTLIGLLDMDTLLRPDGLPRVALAAALGFVIVYLMGEIVRTVMVLAAGTQEHYDESPRNSPKLKASIPLTALAAAICLILATGEITAEGLGLRMLHAQEVTREMRFKGVNTPAPQDEPLLIYMLIGTLISGPYLLYKATHTWKSASDNMRESWLHHMQRRWEAEFRTDPNVRTALSIAHKADKSADHVAHLRQELSILRERRADLQNADLPAEAAERAVASRAAAVGEMSRMNEMIKEIVEAREPLPRRNEHSEVPKIQREQTSFLNKLLGR